MKVPVLLGNNKIIGPLNAGTVILNNRCRIMLGAPQVCKQMPKPHDVFDCRAKGKILSLHCRSGDSPLEPEGPNDGSIPKEKEV